MHVFNLLAKITKKNCIKFSGQSCLKMTVKFVFKKLHIMFHDKLEVDLTQTQPPVRKPKKKNTFGDFEGKLWNKRKARHVNRFPKNQNTRPLRKLFVLPYTIFSFLNFCVKPIQGRTAFYKNHDHVISPKWPFFTAIVALTHHFHHRQDKIHCRGA